MVAAESMIKEEVGIPKPEQPLVKRPRTVAACDATLDAVSLASASDQPVQRAPGTSDCTQSSNDQAQQIQAPKDPALVTAHAAPTPWGGSLAATAAPHTSISPATLVPQHPAPLAAVQPVNLQSAAAHVGQPAVPQRRGPRIKPHIPRPGDPEDTDPLAGWKVEGDVLTLISDDEAADTQPKKAIKDTSGSATVEVATAGGAGAGAGSGGGTGTVGTHVTSVGVQRSEQEGSAVCVQHSQGHSAGLEPVSLLQCAIIASPPGGE